MCDPLIRIAVIGCGAITERGHLPAVARIPNARVTLLVDRNRNRAEALAHQYAVPYVVEDYTQAWDKADAAVVALPHYLHAPVSIDLLTHGVHVLVEKPMALNAADCDAMIAASQQSGATLAVGIMRRFFASYQFIKSVVIGGNFIGKIKSFDIREGSVYNWPVTSDFFFRKDTAGGGVLIDTGAYTMDMVQWWFGDCNSVEYFDDNMGGIEANCEINLQMSNGIEGYVELSRMRKLRNTAIIQGDKGTIEVALHSPQISLQMRGVNKKIIGQITEEANAISIKGYSLINILTAELENWVQAIQKKQAPCVSGKDGRKSVVLIEECYKVRKSLKLPWFSPNPAEGITR